ncbi:MAG: (2Fe-2S)-binding protein [Myxococcales bacterium]|jgi:bacterioferritin-associated ferredoxin|nr:(2Fe-2S)-binding protein [Myxococcales bacterium]MBL0196995.1 (2Fe-2S)-binding protein [Myxococcales bacterium]
MAKAFVCRCEDVTVHELDDAIARGYTDIESLKRYTGFGTGYCQGKACVALCARRLVEAGHSAALPFTPRPPFHPLRLAALAGLAAIAEEDARDERAREARAVAGCAASDEDEPVEAGPEASGE